MKIYKMMLMGALLVVLGMGCGNNEVTLSPLDSPLESAKPTVPSTPDYVSEGTYHLNQGAYEDAVNAYTEAIQSRDNLALAYRGRGDAYTAQRKFQKALEDYSASLDKARTPDILIRRCKVYRILNKPELALEDCNAALSLEEEAVDAYVARAGVYLQQNDIVSARADINTALELNPDSVKAYYTQSQIETVQGNLDAAIDALNKCIDLEPENLTCYWDRGYLFYAMGQVEEAREDMEYIVEVGDPSVQGELMYQAGNILRTLGDNP
jgi:tetratricopeptide (TPR) repeat protein